MRSDEAVYEACERWGQSAAFYRKVSPSTTTYEVGYFEQEGNRLVFNIEGRANTLEGAFAQADTRRRNRGASR